LASSTLVVLMVASFSVLRVLDAALAQMHPPGHPSLTATGMASPRTLWSVSAVAEAAQSWAAWSTAHQAGGLEHAGVLRRYLVVDILGIALPLFVLLRRARRRTSQHLDGLPDQVLAGDQRITGIRHILTDTIVPVTGYLLADIAEDLLVLRAGTGGGSSTVGWLGVVSLAKWLFLIFSVIPLGLAVLRTPVTRSRAKEVVAAARDRRRPQVIALRGQLLVATLLAAVICLPGDLGRQVDDAVLLLTDRGDLALWTAAAAVALAVLVYMTGTWCLAAFDDEPIPDDARFRRWVPGLLVAAVVLILLGFLAFRGRWVFGVVALVPGVLLVIFLLLSLKRFAAPTVRPRPEPPAGSADPTGRQPPGHAGDAEVALPPEAVAASEVTMEFAMADLKIGAPARASLGPDLGGADAGQEPDRLRLLRILSVSPLLVLAIVAIRDAFALRMIGASVGLGSAGAVAVAVCCTWLALGPTTQRDGDSPLGRVAIAAIAVAGIGMVAVGAVATLPLGRWGGPWTMLLAFMAAILLTVTALVLAGDRIPAYGAFSIMGFRRTPLIVVLLLCFLGSSLVSNNWRYHDVRLLEKAKLPQPSTGAPNRRALDLESALKTWMADPYVNQQVKRAKETKAPVPIVFIAAAGGGIRAAYWTTAVLHCLFGDQEWKPPPGTAAGDAPDCTTQALPDGATFLASGISGSSLALALTGARKGHTDYGKVLGADFLGPTLAAMAFRDTPNSLLRISVAGGDRAAILEQAWENAADAYGADLGAGFVERSWDGDQPRFPLLALNGTSVVDGCRLTVSILNLATPIGEPLPTDGATEDNIEASCLNVDDITSATEKYPSLGGTKDVFDRTCPWWDAKDHTPRDLRLSTAALLSARFPYVSPSGALTSCLNPDHRTFDLDGGLIDSSAAGPIAQVWPQVVSWLADPEHNGGRCVAPKLLLIDNGYVSRTQSKPAQRPQELFAPVKANSAISDSRTPAARQAAALAFQRAFPTPACAKPSQQLVSNVAHFYPFAHPGVQAPLGWTLSRWSRGDLDDQLVNSRNACQARIVRAWFSAPKTPIACSD
jgi:hypothetical protein